MPLPSATGSRIKASLLFERARWRNPLDTIENLRKLRKPCVKNLPSGYLKPSSSLSKSKVGLRIRARGFASGAARLRRRATMAPRLETRCRLPEGPEARRASTSGDGKGSMPGHGVLNIHPGHQGARYWADDV